jgi:16S rRNA (guanine527-N7)-methyltransferase
VTPEAFRAATGVSRETLARLERYAELLVHWNRRVNLVGRATLSDLWYRHMLDSAQLFPLIPRDARTLVDLGSGAGFPGMVLAILGVPGVHLIESNKRKCAFLEAVARETEAAVTVHAMRIEEIEPFSADVITARAVAPLGKLLHLGVRFSTKHSILLFLRGRSAIEELTGAQNEWIMRVDQIPSQTDSEGLILRLEAISRVLHPQ